MNKLLLESSVVWRKPYSASLDNIPLRNTEVRKAREKMIEATENYSRVLRLEMASCKHEEVVECGMLFELTRMCLNCGHTEEWLL